MPRRKYKAEEIIQHLRTAELETECSRLKVSERLACRVIGHLRTTQRYVPQPNPEREKIRARIIELATQYGRYGYKTITSFLQLEGFDVGKDSVHRVWREEGLQVPQKQPKRARLWLTDGSCIQLRPTHKNHVWSYDFVSEQTHDGRKFRILNIIDEYTRECLASFVARRIRSQDVILILADLFIEHGIPEPIRSDNGPEFVARKLMSWFKTLKVKPLFIEKGSPWENGYCESFNGKMRYLLLDGEDTTTKSDLIRVSEADPHLLQKLESQIWSLSAIYELCKWYKNSRPVNKLKWDFPTFDVFPLT